MLILIILLNHTKLKYEYKKNMNKFIPKKKFGQNFLKNKEIIKKIIFFIQPKKNNFLIEIGPGLGSLTIPITKFKSTVFVIEIDNKLCIFLKKIFKNSKKIKIINSNILYFNYLEILNKNSINIENRIFGNLPYNICTKIILNLTKYNKYILDMHFMVQYEVGCRIFAIPGSKFYGRLSVILQYYYKIIPLMIVKSDNFFPKPKVNSYFIRFIPHKNKYPDVDVFKLKEITKIAFSQRRKIIKNSLSKIFTNKIFVKLGIDSNLRAQNLTVLDYCRLTYFF